MEQINLTENVMDELREKEIELSFQKVRLARHSDRPYALDIIDNLFTDFVEIHGDRRFADDKSVVCGFARFSSSGVVVIGQQKGRDTKQRRERNFGMPKPEGYRKALRVMKMAEKFCCPIFTFVDTPGAYPGIDAEERGQAEAIARNLLEMARLRVPVIVTVIGEGGSGGALAIAVGDRVLMSENAIYSVITPEGCAAILWRDASNAPSAAHSLKLTASDLYGFGIADEIIKEPEGGAQNGLEEFYSNLGIKLKDSLEKAICVPSMERMESRYKKLRKLGKWGLLGT